MSAYTDSTSGELPGELTALAMLRLEGGGCGHIFTSRRTPFAQENVIVHDTQRTIVCSSSFRTDAQGLTGPPTLTVTTADGKSVVEHAKSPCYRGEVEQFNRYISEDGEPMSSGQDGLINMAITEAIYESASGGRSMRVSDFL